MCSWLHFQTLPARIIIALGILLLTQILITRPIHRFLRDWDFWLIAVAQSCLLPRGTPSSRESHLTWHHLGAVISPWGQTSTMTYWYRKPWLPCLSGATNKQSALWGREWKLGFGWTHLSALLFLLLWGLCPSLLWVSDKSTTSYIKWMEAYPKVLHQQKSNQDN